MRSLLVNPNYNPHRCDQSYPLHYPIRNPNDLHLPPNLQASGVRLVLGGEPKGALEELDYLKLNTGVMLLRVHGWTLSLLRRMLSIGK